MLRTPVTQLLIFAVLMVPLSHPIFAQPSSEGKVGRASTEGRPGPADAPDFKKIAADARKQDASRDVDVKAIEKIDRQQPARTGLTGKQKLAIVLGIIGTAALVFVLIKYGKECKVSDPPGCTPGVDDNCICREYAQNL